MNIFTKTYKKDFPWLWTMLRSLKKFCRAPVFHLIVVDNAKEMDEVRVACCNLGWQATIILAEEKWPEVKDLPGYQGSQWIKMNLHRYDWGTNHVLIWDSDIFAISQFCEQSFSSGGLRCMWVKHHGIDEDNTLRIARVERSEFLKFFFDTPFDRLDYMVCQPIWIYITACEELEKRSVEMLSFLKSSKKGISDSCVLGMVTKTWFPYAFVWKVFSDEAWQGDYRNKKSISVRYWSWGDDPIGARHVWEENCT